ncbi:hypothetical protein JB92DRAFT_2836371 [Gautieria morchelliformis]|nr:hypothetical protein JB92DRAFT_2836371 [Gautieria morchelliformis]
MNQFQWKKFRFNELVSGVDSWVFGVPTAEDQWIEPGIPSRRPLGSCGVVTYNPWFYHHISEMQQLNKFIPGRFTYIGAAVRWEPKGDGEGLRKVDDILLEMADGRQCEPEMGQATREPLITEGVAGDATATATPTRDAWGHVVSMYRG